MAESDDPADAAARLEQALERIAALSSRAAQPHGATMDAPPPRPPAIDTTAVAARLDTLIERIRATLDPSSEG